MRQREGSLELDKNVNKTMIVSGTTGTGFYCDVCKRTNKDSVAYLDHINGRSRQSLTFPSLRSRPSSQLYGRLHPYSPPRDPFHHPRRAPLAQKPATDHRPRALPQTCGGSAKRPR